MMGDYTKQIRKFWPTIMKAWEDHAEKRPVIECDLVNNKVRAYASSEYIDSLSDRTRETTRLEFARTMDEGGIMVFVMDTKNRVLQSCSFPSVGKASKKRPNRPSHRRRAALAQRG